MTDPAPYGMVGVMLAMRAGSIPEAITAADRAVLLVYADFGGREGFAWPSLAEVGRVLGCSLDSVKRSIKTLRTHGLMVEVKPGSMPRGAAERFLRLRRDRAPTVYRVQVAPPQVAPPQVAPPQVAPPQVAPPQVAPHGGANCTPNRTHRFTKGVALARLAPAEPPPVESKPVKPRAVAATKPPHSRHHEVFRHYVEAFTRVRGERPATAGRQGGRTASSISQLLEARAGDADRAMRTIDRALQDGRQPDIHLIAANPDRYGPASWATERSADEEHRPVNPLPDDYPLPKPLLDRRTA